MRRTLMRIFCFALALCFAALSLSSCGFMFRPKYYKGIFGHTFMPDEIMLGVGADKKEFPIDSVDLQLYYALYPMDTKMYDPEDPVRGYRLEKGDTVLFGLYIRPYNDHTVAQYIDKPVDYTDIENNHFVKAITQEEAASKEYGYKMSFIMDMVRYHHSETIRIPEEFFKDKNGFFEIVISVFRIPEGTEDCYFANAGGGCSIGYKIIDENTVELALNN